MTALREWDKKIAAEAGDDAVWLACSHGDVIKAVVADALGMHLDLFQRINVDPCSVTVIRYAELRSFALRVNDNGGTHRRSAPAEEEEPQPPQAVFRCGRRRRQPAPEYGQCAAVIGHVRSR